MAESHVGDVGTQIILTFCDQDKEPVNLVGFSVLKVKIQKPSGTLLTRNGILIGGGTSGKVKYTTVAEDFSEEGAYQIQGYVELPGGKWHSNVIKHTVAKNLTEPAPSP